MSRIARLRVYIVPFVLIAGVLFAMIRAEQDERANDAIYQAEVKTNRLLADFERTGDSTELRAWMAEADSASGTQTYTTLIEWSCKHQDKFINLMDAVPAKERKQAIKWLVWIAWDSGQEVDFHRAFRRCQSPVIRKILKEIEKRPNVEWEE